MMHKAWYSIEEVPYCFLRSSIKFQDHMGWKINDLNPIWVRLLGRSQLSNPSDLPCLNLILMIKKKSKLGFFEVFGNFLKKVLMFYHKTFTGISRVLSGVYKVWAGGGHISGLFFNVVFHWCILSIVDLYYSMYFKINKSFSSSSSICLMILNLAKSSAISDGPMAFNEHCI